jgi:hypothetical protein
MALGSSGRKISKKICQGFQVELVIGSGNPNVGLSDKKSDSRQVIKSQTCR